jgi:acyl-CoA reductase-like NAD-dependent aldehyde dehydrogenase
MAQEIAIQDYKLVIDGQLVDSATGETFETVSPANNEIVGRVAKASPEDVNRPEGFR